MFTIIYRSLYLSCLGRPVFSLPHMQSFCSPVYITILKTGQHCALVFAVSYHRITLFAVGFNWQYLNSVCFWAIVHRYSSLVFHFPISQNCSRSVFLFSFNCFLCVAHCPYHWLAPYSVPSNALPSCCVPPLYKIYYCLLYINVFLIHSLFWSSHIAAFWLSLGFVLLLHCLGVPALILVYTQFVLSFFCWC